MTVFSNIYDTATPLGTDAPSTLDDQDRNTKAAVQERADVDHFWEVTGTQVSDADAGEHRKITLHEPIADPSNVGDKGFIYMKDVSGLVELFWQDEAGNILQLTRGGALNVTSSDLLGILANNTYLTAVDKAGTGTVELIKANASDVAVIPDGSELATSGAPTADADIANKKYVDDQVAPSQFGSLTAIDSDANALLKDHAYLTQQDGIVTAYDEGEALSSELKGYNGTTSNPAGVGTKVASMKNGADQGSGGAQTITFPVASGRYFEVTDSTGTPTILWQKTRNAGGNPIDQD